MPMSELEKCCRCKNRALLVIANPSSVKYGGVVSLTAVGAVGAVQWRESWPGLGGKPVGTLIPMGGNSAQYIVPEDCYCPYPHSYSVRVSATDECGGGSSTTSFTVTYWPFAYTVTPFCNGSAEAFSLAIEGGCPPWKLEKYTGGSWQHVTNIAKGSSFTLDSYAAPSCSVSYRIRKFACESPYEQEWEQFTLTPTGLCVTCETPDRPSSVSIGGGPAGWRVSLSTNYNITLTGAETYTGRVVWTTNNAGCSMTNQTATGATLNVGSTACDYNNGQITITVEVGPECCDILDTQTAQAGTWVMISETDYKPGLSACFTYPLGYPQGGLHYTTSCNVYPSALTWDHYEFACANNFFCCGCTVCTPVWTVPVGCTDPIGDCYSYLHPTTEPVQECQHGQRLLHLERHYEWKCP